MTLEPLRRRGYLGRGVCIGHLDTGVDAAHPALQGKVAGFLYVNEEGLPEPERAAFDSGTHGTHTAGLICGGVHEGRLLGGAPEARLYSAAVIEHGKVPVRLLTGLEWLLEQPIRIAVLSLGIHTPTPLLAEALEALRRKGVLTIAAIGNGGSGRYQSPGHYERVLSVGACHGDGTVARFSGSYYAPGSEECLKPELLAPGVELLSSAPGGGCAEDSGTSMACAYVAGVAAALWEARPEATVDELEAALVRTAAPLPAPWRHRCRAGLLQPEAALELLLERRPVSSREPGAPPPARAPRFIDPRLIRKLRFSTEEEELEAIVLLRHEAREGNARRALDQVLTGCAASTGLSPSSLRLLHQGTVGVIHARARFISELVAHPSIALAHSTELDLL